MYDFLDEEGRGCLDADRMQYFLLALLMNEIKNENLNQMPDLIRKQTKALMDHMFHFSGHITSR